jgi:hypothetical protein
MVSGQLVTTTYSEAVEMGGKPQKSTPDMVVFTLFLVTMTRAAATLGARGKSAGMPGAVHG